MGVSAYNRGSACLSRALHREQDDKRERQLLVRAIYLAEQEFPRVEEYCLNAQTLLVDIMYLDTSRTMVKGFLHETYVKKKDTKWLMDMEDEISAAHSAWVNSDHRNMIAHLVICRRKASAIKSLIDKLSGKFTYQMPFDTPRHI